MYGAGSGYQQSFGERPMLYREVRGLRTWYAVGTGCLYGQQNKRWDRGINTSYCLGPTDHPFHPQCTCGFYGYFQSPFESDMRAGLISYAFNATGVIRGFGPTVVGNRGFRSHKAEILALCINESAFPFLPEGDDPILFATRDDAVRIISQCYPGVAVFLSYKEMLAEFPPTDPGEIGDIRDPEERDRFKHHRNPWIV